MAKAKLYFLDFEASSLDARSFPIEIAWVDQNGQGESYLIEPHRTWNDWSAASECIHHISQETLTRHGTPVKTVARRAQAVLSNALIISDQPVFEDYWLTMLLKVIDGPPLMVHDIHSLLGQEIKRVRDAIQVERGSREWHRQARTFLDEAQIVAMTAFEGANLGLTTVHRALPDAEALWRGWHAAAQAIDRLCVRIMSDMV